MALGVEANETTECLPRTRRTQVDIIVTLLERAVRGATRTALVYQANLNFTLVRKYTALLQSKSMLELVQTSRGPMYRTTETGLEALKSLKSAMNLVFEPRVPSSSDHNFP
jgi:predicted transcriptional regulator